MSDYLKIGQISGFFGVNGWIKLFSYSRPRENICAYKKFYLGDDKKVIAFDEIKKNNKNIIGQIENVSNKEDATEYIYGDLYIKKNSLPDLNNEYYWHQIIGLTVINRKNIIIGNVNSMIETGANDVLVIINNEKEEILIPYAIPEYVESIDLIKNEIIVNWDIN